MGDESQYPAVTLVDYARWLKVENGRLRALLKRVLREGIEPTCQLFCKIAEAVQKGTDT